MCDLFLLKTIFSSLNDLDYYSMWATFFNKFCNLHFPFFVPQTCYRYRFTRPPMTNQNYFHVQKNWIHMIFVLFTGANEIYKHHNTRIPYSVFGACLEYWHVLWNRIMLVMSFVMRCIYECIHLKCESIRTNCLKKCWLIMLSYNNCNHSNLSRCPDNLFKKTV